VSATLEALPRSRLGYWQLSGTYLEACNCDAICPCRRVGGRPGGRSTDGICMGALSWAIELGRAGDVDLDGQRVVLVSRYDDDEAGSPWDFVLFLDDDADASQREALEAIFLGQAGGTPLRQFPWAFKPSRLVDVRTATIELDHTPRRGLFRVGRDVEVRVVGEVAAQQRVTCVIPGHHQPGTEVVADLTSRVAPVDYDFRGRCGYESRFAYSSD
jgi:hypothetical protein